MYLKEACRLVPASVVQHCFLASLFHINSQVLAMVMALLWKKTIQKIVSIIVRIRDDNSKWGETARGHGWGRA